jgi:beta propeller repeat protein
MFSTPLLIRLVSVLALLVLLVPSVPGRAAAPSWRVDEFLVASPAAHQFAPAASGSLVIWSDQRETGASLRGKNLLTGSEFDVVNARVDPLAVRESALNPAISGSIVVWQNRGISADGTHFDRIYGRDLAQPNAAPFPIATTRSGQLKPAISHTIVVWADNRRGNWDIFGYDIANKREFVVTTRPGDQLWPTVSGNLVVWADESADSWNIMAKDLAAGEEITVTTAASNQTVPATNGRVVVWEDNRASRSRSAIYGFDLTTKQEFAIGDSTGYDIRPTIADDLVVWERYEDSERDLVAFDLRTKREFPVTVAPGPQWQPVLSGNLLVWSDARFGTFDVFGAWFRKTEFVPAKPDAAFNALWRETDGLIASGAVNRTWLWSPEPFQSGIEDYAEAPGGRRLVQYHDKSRMEITDPKGNKAGPWYVTNGLLVKELVQGQIQLGDQTFEPLAPAEIPVAGDADDALGPTYASLAAVLDRPAGKVGETVTETIDRGGTVRRTKAPADVTFAYVVPETRHAVASVFWEFLNSEGPVQRQGKTAQARLFEPTFFATGLPITEPYWTRATVGGETRDVLVQAFERRILTYTPSNPAGWRVEMGNVGRHYYRWRYGA